MPKKKNPNGGSYIDSSDWIKITKGKINPINKKDKPFINKPFINKMGRNKFSIKKNMIGKKWEK